jgi:hypothetical protein
MAAMAAACSFLLLRSPFVDVELPFPGDDLVAWGAEKERRRDEDGEGGRGWNPSSAVKFVGDGGQFESLVDVLYVDDPDGTRE